jgi:mannosyltransferase OCH1-like enzyme
MLIPQVIVQTSKLQFPKKLVNWWGENLNSSWKIERFYDDDIINFFHENPLEEFPNILNVFNQLEFGQHKADLFRYYYLYINGGVYIDSDAVINDIENFTKIINNFDHFFVKSDLELNKNFDPRNAHPNIYNGFIGCIPKSDIIYQALKHIYNTNPKHCSRYYHIFLTKLNQIAMSNKYYNIKYFNEFMFNVNDDKVLILDNDKTIAIHYYQLNFPPH